MSIHFVENLTMVTEVCCKCRVTFAMPESWRDHYRKTHEDFYCPAGHGQHYLAESVEETLRKRLAQAQTSIEHKDAALRDSHKRVDAKIEQIRHVEAQRNGYKGALKCAKVRARAGVCPCCTRTFSNIVRHMATKHPDQIPSHSIAE